MLKIYKKGSEVIFDYGASADSKLRLDRLYRKHSGEIYARFKPNSLGSVGEVLIVEAHLKKLKALGVEIQEGH